MKELFSALVKASAKIGGAVKGKTNPHFKSKYADLASVVDAVKEPLAENGLAFLQRFSEKEGGVSVETVIIHESGQEYATGYLFVPASKIDAQGYGSAITYARRYSLQTAFGVPSEDDDGNAASKPGQALAAPITPATEDIARCDPKLLGKIVDKLREHVGADRVLGIREEWEPLEDHYKVAVWRSLTTAEKNAVKAATHKEAA